MKIEYVQHADGTASVRRVIEPEDRLRWAKVPERFRGRVLAGGWLRTDALQATQRLGGDALLLVLSGKPGCGKSFAAATLFREREGLWVHAPDLSKPPVRRQPGEEPDGDEETLVHDGKMRAAKLLVLDDVGIEHSPSGYAASRISDVVEAREAGLLPTVITTNLSGEQFKKRYGPRLASRINGDAIGFVVCRGSDLRIRSGLRSVQP